MNRRVKLDLDYKILHTSGLKVVKNMTEKLVQEDLDSVTDLDEFMEDHSPQDLETKEEAENVIAEFKTYMERFKRCQSELKVALGESYGDKYSGRENSKRTFRKYLRELETRAKELRREERTRADSIAAEKETRERANTLKLEEMRLAHEATERALERKLAAEKDARDAQLAADERALERELAAERERADR